MTSDQVISVFGSNAPLPGSKDYEVARKLGFGLAKAGFSVATGGYAGTMAAVGQGASEGNGHVIGVTSTRIEEFRNISPNEWLAQEIKYDTLSERLMHLVFQNDGMIVLPGGIGTLSEFTLAWSFMQVGEIKSRPLILIGSIWEALLEAFVQPQYVLADHVQLTKIVSSPSEAINVLLNYETIDNRD
jgi:uncharacterized protein (TIGR00730 family)